MAQAQCETCGNHYDKTFQVTMDGAPHQFDSFECAIEALAPRCNHCHCRIIGHGVEQGSDVYCCKSCAEATGPTALRDRV